ASYQIEGAVTEDGRGSSVWDDLCRRPGFIDNGDTGDVACDHYHRWREDLALLGNLGVDAYRFSVSWSRVLPDGVGRIEPRGLAFYDRLVDGLLERGIDPMVTLFHWDLPSALQSHGGWSNRDCSDWFTQYALIVFEALGDRVQRWGTLNEPWCHAFLGYGSGEHAPGIQDPARAVAAGHHLLLGHGRAVAAMRASARADGSHRFGVVLNPSPVRSDPSDPIDDDAVRRVDGTMNRFFLEPLLLGRYPHDLMSDLGDWAACVVPGDEAEIAVPLDWLGINYYFDNILRPNPEPVPTAHVTAPHVRPALPAPDATDMGWPITPKGLSEMLIGFRDRYAPLPPIYITENGVAYDDPVVNGTCHDERRIAFHGAYLSELGVAMDAGVRVDGYFAWTLLDNFEWAKGYRTRFGLVHVDHATQVRTPRDSFHWYREVCETGRLPRR
ncbi:MAG: GH1 family beta-glucosidase, partial [Acidimicrobiia bacterium]